MDEPRGSTTASAEVETRVVVLPARGVVPNVCRIGSAMEGRESFALVRTSATANAKFSPKAGVVGSNPTGGTTPDLHEQGPRPAGTLPWASACRPEESRLG